MLRKKVGAVVLSLLVAAYCTFGFMECFEPGAALADVFEVVYAMIGAGSLAAAGLYAARAPGGN
jgi:hypothetical protein